MGGADLQQVPSSFCTPLQSRRRPARLFSSTPPGGAFAASDEAVLDFAESIEKKESSLSIPLQLEEQKPAARAVCDGHHDNTIRASSRLCVGRGLRFVLRQQFASVWTVHTPVCCDQSNQKRHLANSLHRSAPALPRTCRGMTTPARQLRFKVGDRVIANTDDGACAGTVVKVHYREPDWPEVRAQTRVRGAHVSCVRVCISHAHVRTGFCGSISDRARRRGPHIRCDIHIVGCA